MLPLNLPSDWHNPPSEFSLVPFWFWNDALDDREIARQLDEFQRHDVEAFVLHPRIGLPRQLGWMSKGLLAHMRFAIEEAERRGMWVILYDEGMYPSGSASGQVVAENARYQCRGLERIELAPNEVPTVNPNQTLVAVVPYNSKRYAIIDRPTDSVIRGLHFLDENSDAPPEDSPPAADLLNPDAVASFIRHSYERYHEAFGRYFGKTIPAIFTDEPNLLGRTQETGIIPGTTDILHHVNEFLGYDFTLNLPALWEDGQDALRETYMRAVEKRLETTYYQQLYHWCEAHGIALTGHPAEPDATTSLRFFQIPGQDIVWRMIEPDQPSALEGRQSTQAKAASSAMLHAGRRRNANEFCGAYGDTLSFDEMRWLANWLLVRGCNLLIPHAFYYSVRGPRKHERPPDVGLHSRWWNTDFAAFALGSKRLCWLNTDSEHVCEVAIVGEHHHLAWRAAKTLLQHQIDFNYLDADDLLDAVVTGSGLQVGRQHYRALIVDGVLRTDIEAIGRKLADTVPVLIWSEDVNACLAGLQAVVSSKLRISPAYHGLRVRHVRKAGFNWYVLFNEAEEAVDFVLDLPVSGSVIEPYTNIVQPFDGRLSLPGHALRVIVIPEVEQGTYA